MPGLRVLSPWVLRVFAWGDAPGVVLRVRVTPWSFPPS